MKITRVSALLKEKLKLTYSVSPEIIGTLQKELSNAFQASYEYETHFSSHKKIIQLIQGQSPQTLRNAVLPFLQSLQINKNAVLAPEMIYRKSQYTQLAEAILRGDSGQGEHWRQILLDAFQQNLMKTGSFDEIFI